MARTEYTQLQTAKQWKKQHPNLIHSAKNTWYIYLWNIAPLDIVGFGRQNSVTIPEPAIMFILYVCGGTVLYLKFKSRSNAKFSFVNSMYTQFSIFLYRFPGLSTCVCFCVYIVQQFLIFICIYRCVYCVSVYCAVFLPFGHCFCHFLLIHYASHNTPHYSLYLDMFYTVYIFPVCSNWFRICYAAKRNIIYLLALWLLLLYLLDAIQHRDVLSFCMFFFYLASSWTYKLKISFDEICSILK